MTDKELDDIIKKQIDEERARRPKGWAQRCERCCFWEADEPREDTHSEDQRGYCHRHAPHIPHHHMAEGIGIIAWAVEEIANIDHSKDFDYGYESVESPWSDWPRTIAADWCGDFGERPS